MKHKLDFENTLPPLALLMLREKLRLLRPGDTLEILVHSRELLADIERILTTTSAKYEKISVNNHVWQIFVASPE